MERPLLAITMGDPAGVGPEITVKALCGPQLYQVCRPLVIGNTEILRRAAFTVREDGVNFRRVSAPADGLYRAGCIDVLEIETAGAETVRPGVLSAEAGEAAFRYVEKAIELAMNGAVDGTVTNPINKEAVNLAGHHFSGHTEIYAEYTGTKKIHHDACARKPGSNGTSFIAGSSIWMRNASAIAVRRININTKETNRKSLLYKLFCGCRSLGGIRSSGQ